MSYKINVKTNATKFKSAPRNPLDIPTGPLDKPLTTGYEKSDYDSKMKAEHDRLSDLQDIQDNMYNLSHSIRSYENIHGDEVVISFKKS